MIFFPATLILGFSGLTPLLLYIGAIIAFLLSIFWRPHFGLYFVVPLLPLQTVRYLLHDLPMGEKLVDFVLLGVILGLLVQRKGKIFAHTGLNGFFVLWAAFHYVSLWRGALFLGGDFPAWITDPRFSNWKNYMIMPLICVLITAAIREKRQIKILLVLMLLSVLRANLGFYNTVSERDFSHFSYGLRYAGTFGYAGENGLAAFEAQLALFCLALNAFVHSWRVKLPLLAFAGVSVYCLLLSFSRGAISVFLSGCCFSGSCEIVSFFWSSLPSSLDGKPWFPMLLASAFS